LEQLQIEETNFFTEEHDEFWDNISEYVKLSAIRKKELLNWRYRDPRNGPHTVFTARYKGKVFGYITFRVNHNKSGYQIGFITDLVNHPELPEISHWLIKKAVRQLERQGVNTILALSIEGHPQNRFLRKNNFIDSRYPIQIHMEPHMKFSHIEKWFKDLKSSEMLLNYGDFDSLPVNLPSDFNLFKHLF
jgi:hypothetical protein